MGRKVTFIDVVVISALVAVAFVVCNTSKTLVGFLFVVPMLFLPVGIMWILLVGRPPSDPPQPPTDGIEGREV